MSSSVDSQVCPKCGGQGFVAKPPWVAGDQHSWPSVDTGSYSCPVCHGAKVVARAALGEEA
jgi:RNA polymerase subunit RPABC4/transcription elongation factor Spt4